MSTLTSVCDYNRYKWSSGSTWGAPDDGTRLYAGKDGSGTYFATLLRFPFAALLGSATVNNATLGMTRFTDQSSAAKTLLVAVVTANIGDGTHTIVSGPISWNVTSGAGTKTCNIASLMPALLDAPASRYLMLFSGDSGQYTEFRSIEYGTSTDPYIDLDYSLGTIRYGTGSTWQECEVYYGTGGSWVKVAPYYGADGTWKPIGG